MWGIFSSKEDEFFVVEISTGPHGLAAAAF